MTINAFNHGPNLMLIYWEWTHQGEFYPCITKACAVSEGIPDGRLAGVGEHFMILLSTKSISTYL